MAEKGSLSAELKVLRRDLQAAQPKAAEAAAASAAPSAADTKAGAA